ncbi:MAG: hypothetical protein ACLQGP_34395 [Isosphaeraceae bacterium]
MDASGVPRQGSGEPGTVASPTDERRKIPSRPRGGVLARPAKGLVRFLYTSNPFYILSADLVFVGLRMSFGPGGPAAQSWALTMSLAGYTLLLATTACLLIRVGRLWDDLRSLLVLVVMMFLAIAMSCDDNMAANASKGALGYVAGFLFAVVVTEVVLNTIHLRLPGWYRLAYYAILGLVFLYPVALIPLLGDPENPTLQWALFGFSPMAALAITTLVPAARRGRAFLEKNGSPWRWPMYPWALFFVLVGGLCVRSMSLCVSFHYVEGHRTIFGPYFLVPIGLAVSLVWLEIGIISGRRRIMTAASALPLGLVFLAMAGQADDPVYRAFLELFIRTLGGSPAHITLLATTLFVAYAISRHVPRAWDLMAIALAGLAVVGPRTIDLDGLVSPRALPMGVTGLVLASTAWRHRNSRRAALAAGFLVAAIARGIGDIWPTAELWPIALHLGVASLLVLGVLFNDGVGRLARRSGALALLVLGLDASTGHPFIWPSMPPGLVTWYPLLIAALAWSYGYRLHDRLYLGSGAVSATGWMMHSGGETYAQLRKVVVGLDQIAWGMVCFLIAMTISLKKAGIWPRSMPKRLAWLVGHLWPAWWESAPPSSAAVRQETAEA